MKKTSEPDDPPEIAWAPGMPERAWYGTRTDRVVIHNSADATELQQAYIGSLVCRLAPNGILMLTGKVDERWR